MTEQEVRMAARVVIEHSENARRKGHEIHLEWTCWFLGALADGLNAVEAAESASKQLDL